MQCSDNHVRSACIWPDTLCISVHLYEKYAILVITLHCYHARQIYIFYFIHFFFFFIFAKPHTRPKQNLMRNKIRKILFLCLIAKNSCYKVDFN